MSTNEDNKPRFKALEDFDASIPWGKLSSLIGSHFATAKICRSLVPTETMLRIYFLQKRYQMSASGVEEALFQIAKIRHFAKINLEKDIIPNDACITAFEKLIKERGFQKFIDDAFDIRPL